VSSGALASAGAQSHFVGTFIGTGPLTLNLGFTSVNSVLGGAFASGTLFVLLTNTLGATTTKLFDDLFTVGDDITLAFALAGGVSTLDLVLFSEADASGARQTAQNFAQVVFAGTIGATAIPEPGTLALAGLALLGLAATRRRTAG
jgi:PEP-CTERM motif